MRAAIYARVSTEDQAKEGFSIAAQQKRLIAYCKARGWQLANEYIDDGYSGRSIIRPAYHKMMSEIDNWDVLVVLKMDRIHRNSKNFTSMMDLLKEHNKEFNSMQESFDTTTAIGRFVMDIIQRIAQLESEQIGERVKMGMTQKAKKGKGHNGFAEPFGYRFDNGHLIREEDQSIVVVEIFSRCLAYESLTDIASWLNQNGITTKKGKSWEKATVYNVLTNPLYCGNLVWDGIEQLNSHPGIVDLPTFFEAQRVLSSRRRSVSPNGGDKARSNGGLAHA
jgi:DNA invertase Pin-like site-specific DNA recombinase